MKRIQYTVVDVHDQQLMSYHQDNSCDPVVDCDLENLIGQLAELYDCSAARIPELFRPAMELDGCRVVREEVETHELTAEELAEFDHLAASI